MAVITVTCYRTTNSQEVYQTEAEAIRADKAEELAIVLRKSSIFWGTCDPMEVADWIQDNFHLTPLKATPK